MSWLGDGVLIEVFMLDVMFEVGFFKFFMFLNVGFGWLSFDNLKWNFVISCVSVVFCFMDMVCYCFWVEVLCINFINIYLNFILLLLLLLKLKIFGMGMFVCFCIYCKVVILVCVLYWG